MNFKTIATIALLLSGASLAHAAQPVGSLACTGSGGNFTLNVSHFELGAADTASSSTGAAVGKVSLLPLTIHAALGSFDSLFASTIGGTVIENCTLSTQASNGSNVQFKLKTVVVSSVTAIASSPSEHSKRAAYVKATLTYGAISVAESGSSVDDGGASVIVGWDVTTNEKV